MRKVRRVVTGLNADGQSTVTIDGDSPPMVWATRQAVADNSDDTDMGGIFDLDIADGGSRFVVTEMAPGQVFDWHATDTIDYVAILEGSITMDLETGSVVLHSGDTVVDRGVRHAWRNEGDRRARMAVVMLPAKPLEGGA